MRKLIQRIVPKEPIKMGYRITAGFGMAGRVSPNDIIEDWESPKFGFYWWFWLPFFKSNGGSLRRRECVDIGVNIFCFWAGVTFWPIRRGLIFGFNSKENSPKSPKR
jgi:hypothetical protein